MKTAIDWYAGQLDIDKMPPSIREDIISFHTDKVYQELTPAEIDAAIRKHNLHNMCPMDILQQWLENEGILGYTHTIKALFDFIVRHSTRVTTE